MHIHTLESALKVLLDNAERIDRKVRVPLADALGRITAEDIYSPMAVPPFDRSPLDGYALHSEDLQGASKDNPALVQVIGEVCAGCADEFFPARGEAVRIMTGGQIPVGCDCVIRQEDTDEGMDTAKIYASVRKNQNICYRGEDVSEGFLITRAGECMTSAHIGVLASLGIGQIFVQDKVRVAFLSTGDELLQPGEVLSRGKIYDANRALISARLSELGVHANVLSSAKDEPEHVAALLVEAAIEADVIITTGGVSVGKKDIMHNVLPLMGAERLFWQVDMKPGSPLLCGLYGGKLVICLSGNPFAALACFELFAKPVLARLAGLVQPVNRRIRATLDGSLLKKSPTRRLVRAYFDGQCVKLKGSNHSSGSLAAMIGCNCLIDIEAGHGELMHGDDVEIVLL